MKLIGKKSDIGHRERSDIAWTLQPLSYLFQAESTHWAVILVAQNFQSGTTEETSGVVTLTHCPDIGLMTTHHTSSLRFTRFTSGHYSR